MIQGFDLTKVGNNKMGGVPIKSICNLIGSEISVNAVTGELVLSEAFITEIYNYKEKLYFIDDTRTILEDDYPDIKITDELLEKVANKMKYKYDNNINHWQNIHNFIEQSK